MWTTENRPKYDRDKLRYPSNLTNEEGQKTVRGTVFSTNEWSELEPLIPPAKRGGRRRSVDLREVMNGVLYVLRRNARKLVMP